MSGVPDLPVLSASLIESWKHAGQHSLVRNVRLGVLPDVLGPARLGWHEVRVWRQSLSRPLRDFIERATECSDKIDRRLLGVFDPDQRITSLGGKLHVTDTDTPASWFRSIRLQPIRPEHIAEALARLPIASELRLAFGDYVVGSLEAILQHGPFRYLRADATHVNYRSRPDENTHKDLSSSILMHFTDPGTAYPENLSRHIDAPTTWRVQAGDINMHGWLALHGFAHRPKENGKCVSRLCLSFNGYG